MTNIKGFTSGWGIRKGMHQMPDFEINLALRHSWF
jgi:hypothetical protein